MEEQHVLEAVVVHVASDGGPNVAGVARDDAEAIGPAVGDTVEVQVGRDASKVHIQGAGGELVGEIVHTITVDIAGTHGSRKL